MESHGSILVIMVLLVVAGVVVLGVVNAGEKDPYAAAKQQFDRHNYREALKLLDDFVKGREDTPPMIEAQALRGQCMIKLNRYHDGKKLLEDLFDKNPGLAKRPDLHRVIGESAQRYGDIDGGYKHLSAAADLYEADRSKAQAAEVLFKLAELLRHGQLSQTAQAGKPETWEENRKRHAELVGKIYDRIVSFKVDDKTTSEALFRKGTDLRDHFVNVVSPETAIEVWRKLVSDYPGSARAPEAAFQIGLTLEQRLNRFVDAVKAYEQVAKQFPDSKWAKNASAQARVIRSPQLSMRIEGPTLPGKKAEIHWRSRNLKAVELKAYKVELFELIRKLHMPEQFDKWSPRGNPAAEWRLDIPDTGEHRYYASGEENVEPTRMPATDPGAYVVVGTGQSAGREGVRGVILILVSQLGMIAKTAKSDGLIYAVDSLSGQPKPGTEVLVQSMRRDAPLAGNFEYQQGTVDDAGLYQAKYPVGKGTDSINRQLAFFVRSGDHYAICRDLYNWGWWGQREAFRVYAFTERPVYRPKQTVRFKETLRRYDMGRYENAPNQEVKVRINDPRGNVVLEQSYTSNAEGSFSGELILGAEPPLGVYNIDLEIQGQHYGPWHSQGNQFRVEEYKKPEFKVEVTPAKSAYRVGDDIQIQIKADYYFGQPVAGAQVEYEIWRDEFHSTWNPPHPFPWYYEEQAGGWSYGGRGRRWTMARPYPGSYGGRRELVKRGTAVTDAKGIATVGPIKSTPFKNTPEADLRYDVTARVVDKSRREIRGAGSVKVTHAPFFIHMDPQQHLYKPGDNAHIDVTAMGPNDDPIAMEGTAAIHRLSSKIVKKDDQEYTEYELGDRVGQVPVKTDTAGRGSFRFTFDEEGLFRMIVSTQTPAGDKVTGQCDIWIAQRGGEYAHYAYRDIEMLPDRDTYETGQTMRLLINTRHADSAVLLTGETDEMILRQVVFIKGKSKVVELPINVGHTPNFHLVVALLRDNQLYQDQRQIIVPPKHQFLSVEVKPSKTSYQPREKGQIVVSVRDSAGKPVSTELAMMMVDASIYYIQPEFRDDIRKAFFGQLRPLMVSTQSSFGYRQYENAARRTGGYGGAAPRAEMAQDSMALGLAVPASPAPMMAKGASRAKMAEAPGKAEPELAQPMVRKEFADAVLWTAHLRTDADGHATVDVTLPDNLTGWKLHAIACDTQTRVGEQSIDLVTKKDLIVRLESPRFLVEKDMVYISAIVHNYLKTAKKVQVELKATPQLKITDARSVAADLGIGEPVKGPQIYRRWVEVPADQEVQVDFVCQAGSPGEVALLAKALTDEVSDAMEVKLPVLEYGADKFIARTGDLTDGADGPVELALDVPAEIKPNSQSLELITQPSIASVMIDALPYLLDYPYGCVEQTMSRFLPAVVTSKSLQKLGISLEQIAALAKQKGGPENARLLAKLSRNPVFDTAKMNDMIQAGLKRLADFQKADGGWGWWKNDESNPYMTAYVVYGLTEAREADVAFDRSILARGVAFLRKRITSPSPVGRWAWTQDDGNVRAWMLMALAGENPGSILSTPEVRGVLDDVFNKRDDMTDYGRALLAIVLARVGDRNRAGVVIENFGNSIRLDEPTRTASWGRNDGWWYWYDNGLETTAMVLRAVLASDPKHKWVSMIVRWLVQNRRGAQWYSTKDTALCVYALSEYLQASGELDPDMTVRIEVDGKLRNELRVTKANVLTLDAVTPVGIEDLQPGKHTVKVARNGRGNLYVSGFLRYYTREDPIKAAGHQVAVTRSYVKLIPKEVTKTRDVWRPNERKHIKEEYQTIEYDRVPVQPGEELSSGTRLEVCLQIEAKNNYEYLIFEDPKPAGCEPVELVSGYAHGGGVYANLELRDQKVVFFATYLSQGTHKLAYELRCETPGVFSALPSRAEAMYTPHVRAISDSARLAIVEKK